jgi:FkbM family methyltransferase
VSIRGLAKDVLPQPLVGLIRKQLRQRNERRFSNQPLTTLRWGGFDLAIPRSHMLRDIAKLDPLRDQAIPNTARCIVRKYPAASFLDIGANIGDTAALLASCTRNRLILVEASDYYFQLLSRNARLFPNETVLVQALVCDGSSIEGAFSHWGGTASFLESESGSRRVRSARLSELADAQTRFIKTDTDGFDFRILRGNLDWLASAKPAIVFENQIRTREDLTQADALFEDLRRIGYSGFIVWDDAGFHLLSTADVRALQHLNRYQFELWQRPVATRISNYDVLCLHRDDGDIFERMCERGSGAS